VVDPADIDAALLPETKLVALTHASNVTGAIQPVAEVARSVRSRGVLLLLDAAQTLGHVPLHVEQLGVDLLAAPGHKGLLGPLGTGLLYIRSGVEERLESVRQGGTGSLSHSDRQPGDLPDKYESGNLNVPGLVGLGAGIAYLQQQGLAALRQHYLELTERLLEGLSNIRGVRLHGPATADDRVGVVSITLQRYDPQEVAAMLDTGYRIQVRPGIQCASLMHRALGTLDHGGTVRFSLGCFTTREEIDAAVSAVEHIATAAMTV
jgi:selenocysteine lyase/cysteine desulfurase